MNRICTKLNKILRRNQQYEEIFNRSKILTPITAKNTNNLAQLFISNVNQACEIARNMTCCIGNQKHTKK